MVHETFAAALRRQRSDLSAASNRLIRAVRMRAQYAAENEENGYSFGFTMRVTIQVTTVVAGARASWPRMQCCHAFVVELGCPGIAGKATDGTRDEDGSTTVPW